MGDQAAGLYCQRCGRLNAAEDRFCAGCGRERTTPAAVPAQHPPPEAHSPGPEPPSPDPDPLEQEPEEQPEPAEPPGPPHPPTGQEDSRSARDPWQPRITARFGLAALLVLIVATVGLVVWCPWCSSGVVGPSGGVVEGPGGVRVVVPGGAVSGEGVVLVSEVEPNSEVEEVFVGVGAAGPAFEIGLEGANLVGEVTIELPYDPGLLPGGVDEGAVFGAWHDEEAGRWVALHGEVDSERNVVAVTTDHFSEYQTKVADPADLEEALTTAWEWVFGAAGVAVVDTFDCDGAGWPPDVIVAELGSPSSEVLVPCLGDPDGRGNASVRVLNSRTYGLLLENYGYLFDLEVNDQRIMGLMDTALTMIYDAGGAYVFVPAGYEAGGHLQFPKPGSSYILYDASDLTLMLDLLLVVLDTLRVETFVDAADCAYRGYQAIERDPDLTWGELWVDFLQPCLVEVAVQAWPGVGDALNAVKVSAVLGQRTLDARSGVDSGMLTLTYSAGEVPAFFTWKAPSPSSVGTFDLCAFDEACRPDTETLSGKLGNPHSHDAERDVDVWTYDGAYFQRVGSYYGFHCNQASGMRLYGGFELCASTLEEIAEAWGHAPDDDWRHQSFVDGELAYVSCTQGTKLTLVSRDHSAPTPGAVTSVGISGIFLPEDDREALGCDNPTGFSASVEPADGSSSIRTLSVRGVTPGAEFRATMATPNRDVVWLFTEPTNDRGEFEGDFTLRPSDPAGTYIVNIEDLATGQTTSVRFDHMGQAALADMRWEPVEDPMADYSDPVGLASGVTPFGGGFVAVGRLGTQPTVWLSGLDGTEFSLADGYLWERVHDPGLSCTCLMFDVATFDPGSGPTLVAVGLEVDVSPNRPVVWTSPDGRRWERVAIDVGASNAYLDSIAADGSKVLVSGHDFDSGMAFLLRSSDLVGWDRVTPTTSAGGVLGELGLLEWAGDRFVAVGGESSDQIGVWGSDGGTAWSALSEPEWASSSLSLVAGPSGLLGLSSEPGDPALTSTWSSVDGVRWEEVAETEGWILDAAPWGDAFVGAGWRGSTGDPDPTLSFWISSAEGLATSGGETCTIPDLIVAVATTIYRYTDCTLQAGYEHDGMGVETAVTDGAGGVVFQEFGYPDADGYAGGDIYWLEAGSTEPTPLVWNVDGRLFETMEGLKYSQRIDEDTIGIFHLSLSRTGDQDPYLRVPVQSEWGVSRVSTIGPYFDGAVDQGGPSIILYNPDDPIFDLTLPKRDPQDCTYGSAGVADCTTPAIYLPDGSLAFGLNDYSEGGTSCWLVVDRFFTDDDSPIPADGTQCGPGTYIATDGRFVLLSDFDGIVLIDLASGTSQVLDFTGRATFVHLDG